MQRKDSIQPTAKTRKYSRAKKKMRFVARPVQMTLQFYSAITREKLLSEIEQADPLSYWF